MAYVITKAHHIYYGGKGYDGPACDKAGIEGGKIYELLCNVVEDAKKLRKIDKVEWVIHIYQPKNYYSTNI